MRTRYQLANKPDKPKSPFYRPKPRTYQPWCTDNLCLENAIEKIRREIDKIECTQSKTDNLTISERQALNALTKRTDLVINKANKGSTIVVQDREQCVSDGLVQLSDRKVYKPLSRDITSTVKAEITTKVETLYRTGMIDKEMRDFCMPPNEHRTSQLYFLKKNPMGI